MEEVRMAMITFDWDVNIPQALRRRPSSLTPQMMLQIPPASTFPDQVRNILPFRRRGGMEGHRRRPPPLQDVPPETRPVHIYG